MSVSCGSVGYMLFYDFCVLGFMANYLMGVRIPLCLVISSLYAGGGSVCCVLGGSSYLYEFVPFGVIFCVEKMAGITLW